MGSACAPLGAGYLQKEDVQQTHHRLDLQRAWARSCANSWRKSWMHVRLLSNLLQVLCIIVHFQMS